MPFGHHGWGHAGGWAWAGGVVWLVTMLLFWAALITLVVFLVRRYRHAGPGGTGGPRQNAEPWQHADRILEERFARGEIDEDEFLRRRAALHRTG